MASAPSDGVLSAPLVIEYPFVRTTGPVISVFLTGLRERLIFGIKGSRGQVIVPPVEYDPDTSEELSEIVEVGPGGVVDTWAWVRQPMPKHPIQHPFAWALVRPDGADVGFLQPVDAGSIDAMSTGMRVRPRWADNREGAIGDLACWEPEH